MPNSDYFDFSDCPTWVAAACKSALYRCTFDFSLLQLGLVLHNHGNPIKVLWNKPISTQLYMQGRANSKNWVAFTIAPYGIYNQVMSTILSPFEDPVFICFVPENVANFPEESIEPIFLHEVGHIVDALVLSSEQRETIGKIMVWWDMETFADNFERTFSNAGVGTIYAYGGYGRILEREARNRIRNTICYWCPNPIEWPTTGLGTSFTFEELTPDFYDYPIDEEPVFTEPPVITPVVSPPTTILPGVINIQILLDCQPDGLNAMQVLWQSLNLADQWVDLSIFNNNFADGTYLGFGPLPANQQSIVWNNLIANTTHYLRINTWDGSQWRTSPTLTFTTKPCAPVVTPPVVPGILKRVNDVFRCHIAFNYSGPTSLIVIYFDVKNSVFFREVTFSLYPVNGQQINVDLVIPIDNSMPLGEYEAILNIVDVVRSKSLASGMTDIIWSLVR